MFGKLKKIDGACYAGTILELFSVDEDVCVCRNEEMRSESISCGRCDIRRDPLSLLGACCALASIQTRMRTMAIADLLQPWLHFVPWLMPVYMYCTTRLSLEAYGKRCLLLIKKCCKIRKPLSFDLTFPHMHLGPAEVRREPTASKQAGHVSILSGNS